MAAVADGDVDGASGESGGRNEPRDVFLMI